MQHFKFCVSILSALLKGMSLRCGVFHETVMWLVVASIFILSPVHVVATTLPEKLNKPSLSTNAGRVWGFYAAAELGLIECSDRFPGQRPHFESLIKPWLERNRLIVNKVNRSSFDSLMKLANNESEQKIALDYWNQAQPLLLDRVKATMLSDLNKDPLAFCEALGSVLSSGNAELGNVYLDELRALDITP